MTGPLRRRDGEASIGRLPALWHRGDLTRGTGGRWATPGHLAITNRAQANDGDDLDIIEFTGRYDLGSGPSLDAMAGANNLDSVNGSPCSDYTARQDGMESWVGL